MIPSGSGIAGRSVPPPGRPEELGEPDIRDRIVGGRLLGAPRKAGYAMKPLTRSVIAVIALSSPFSSQSYLAVSHTDLQELLRPRAARLRRLLERADDGETALGSDVMSAALEGYAMLKMSGKGAGLDALRQGMSARFTRKARVKAVPAAA
jgi:hypothetical protein